MEQSAQLSDPRAVRGLYSVEPEELDALYAVGHRLFDADDFVRAADVFRFLLLAEPARTRGWHALGACHERLDEYDVAAALYEAGFRIDSGALELGLAAARARARSGDGLNAVQLLDEVESADSSEEMALRVRGVRSFLEAGDG